MLGGKWPTSNMALQNSWRSARMVRAGNGARQHPLARRTSRCRLAAKLRAGRAEVPRANRSHPSQPAGDHPEYHSQIRTPAAGCQRGRIWQTREHQQPVRSFPMRLSNIAAAVAVLAVVFLERPNRLWPPNTFFAANGTGSTCSQSAPCSLTEAVAIGNNSEIACADSSDNSANTLSGGTTITVPITIDCAGTAGSIGDLIVDMGAVWSPYGISQCGKIRTLLF